MYVIRYFSFRRLTLPHPAVRLLFHNVAYLLDRSPLVPPFIPTPRHPRPSFVNTKERMIADRHLSDSDNAERHLPIPVIATVIIAIIVAAIYIAFPLS